MSRLRTLKDLAVSENIRAALPALLAAAFCFLNFWLPFRSGAIGMSYPRIASGSFILAGLHNVNVVWTMPLFGTAFSSVLDLGASPVLFLMLPSLACYLLVFSAGCLLRGYRAGIVSLVCAGAFEAAGLLRYDDEQSFYSVSLLLVFSLLLLKRRDNTLKNSLLCGLALGASMLVRAPLVLFPPVVVLFDRFYGGGTVRAFVLRSSLFLAASYVLLLPWGFLNYSISGRFSLIDDRKAACNLITGSEGGIYTMEGDCRKLAGLGEGDSAFGLFAREAAKAPVSFALNFIKRLWHIFLFYPALFGLFLIAMAASRGRPKPLVFGLPVYFILIHAALSVEARYFYPMLYVLPPLIIGGLWPRSADQAAARRAPAGTLIAAVFCLFFCAVLPVEALMLAYPYRASRNLNDREYFTRLPERFPDDRVFQEMKCELLLIKGDEAQAYACLDAYSKKFGDNIAAYFLAAEKSLSPAAVPVPARGEMECYIIRMLRELELGDRNSATASFRLAYAEYERWHNMLRGEPYQKDKELTLKIRGNSDAFWDGYVYRFFLMLPSESAAKTLSELEKIPELPALSKLRALADAFPLGRSDVLMLRKRVWSEMYGAPLLWKEEAEKAKKLSDLAVEKMRSGDLRTAERPLLEAEELNSGAPEVFMNLCFIRLRENEREKALEACQSAANAVYLNPENKLPGLEILAAEASFESYELLKAYDRKTEAGKALRRTVYNSPAAWPGLSRARAALKNERYEEKIQE